MPKISKEDLENYKHLLNKEKELLDKFFQSNENIDKVYYNESIIIIQFNGGYKVDSEYLENLRDLIDYKAYTIEVVTITNEFFKIKYEENILQMNIIL